MDYLPPEILSSLLPSLTELCSFRSDWLYVGDTGNVDTYINQRGWGAGIVPNWVHSGITHTGMGVKGVRNHIKFGRIYGNNRMDYIWLKEENDRWDMHVWENDGAGGTKLKGDGVFYCDMRGTGIDDYVVSDMPVLCCAQIAEFRTTSSERY